MGGKEALMGQEIEELKNSGVGQVSRVDSQGGVTSLG